MNIKKILKWVGLISLVWIVLFFANEFFIIDWRIEHSEQRVQKNIIKNYEDKKEKFDRIIEYVRKLEIIPIIEIEFKRNKKIDSYLKSPFISDSIRMSSNSFDLNVSYDFEDEEIGQPAFEFLHDGKARIDYVNTIIETNNWYWNFEGGRDKPQFEKFIDYLGISESELEILSKLINEANCEAISIYEEGSFSLRYDGISFCQYEYYAPKNDSTRYKLLNEVKLEDNIYCGLNRVSIFCGYVIYDK